MFITRVGNFKGWGIPPKFLHLVHGILVLVGGILANFLVGGAPPPPLYLYQREPYVVTKVFNNYFEIDIVQNWQRIKSLVRGHRAPHFA